MRSSACGRSHTSPRCKRPVGACCAGRTFPPAQPQRPTHPQASPQRAALGRCEGKPSLNSTGFDTHHTSRCYIHRRDNNPEKGEDRPTKQVSYKRYGKLLIVVCCLSHAILAAVASAGPSLDVDQLDGVIKALVPSVKLQRMALDAGFDSAANHRLLREDKGILSTIPPWHDLPSKDPKALPADRWRRLMKRHCIHKTYRKRPQVEMVNSMLNRNLGDSLRGRTHHGRRRDMLLRVLTRNLMLPLLWVFYTADVSPPDW